MPVNSHAGIMPEYARSLPRPPAEQTLPSDSLHDVRHVPLPAARFVRARHLEHSPASRRGPTYSQTSGLAETFEDVELFERSPLAKFT